MAINTVKVEIGTRVNCALWYCGTGTVYGIVGKQSPETVRTMMGVVAMGGSAEFEIVFDNGSKSSTSECIVRGSQWQIFDEVVDAEFIEKALQYADQCADEKAMEESLARLAYAEGLNSLRNDPQYKHLEQGDDRYSGKLAAKNIRTELKSAFKGVKFSVRKAHYGTLYIGWTDGPTKAEVEAVTMRYKIGSFDSMQDLASTNPTPWSDTFGGCDYIFTTREYSDEAISKALAQVEVTYADELDGRPLTLAMYKAGDLHNVYVGCRQDSVSCVARQTLEISPRELADNEQEAA
jgi:hypothetical protein